MTRANKIPYYTIKISFVLFFFQYADQNLKYNLKVVAVTTPERSYCSDQATLKVVLNGRSGKEVP